MNKYIINKIVIAAFIIVAVILGGVVKLHQFEEAQSETYIDKFSAEYIPADRQCRWESRLVYEGETVEGIAKDILNNHPMQEISLGELKSEIMEVNHVSDIIYSGRYLIVPVWDYK